MFCAIQLTTIYIEQLNAAKGRLRVILGRGLFEPNSELLQASCDCRIATLYFYEKHLFNIGVWPLDEAASKTCISRLLYLLRSKFEYEAKPDACVRCRTNYKAAIQSLAMRVGGYFDGLCLDCLDRSKTKFSRPGDDYWQHATLQEDDYCFGCRIEHKQPTWYFSFMGRKEDRDRMLKEKRAKNRARYSSDSDF